MSAITDYLRTVREIHRGQATEHSYRAALAALLEGLRPGVSVMNEPKRNRDYGAVDMRVSDGSGPSALTLGYVECKDTHVSLDEVVKTDQLKRYLANVESLVLTNHLEFRWYVDGKERARATLATGDTLTRTPGGEEQLHDLLHAFLSRTPEPIASPRQLAQAMVDPTRMIRDIIVTQFAHGDRTGETWALYEAFRQTLLPHIKPGEFADMFAQTLAYGLFAARVNHKPGQPFTRRDAPYEIPATNPFLRKLFTTIAGPDLDQEPYVGYVDDLTRLLAHADIGAILADFGARTRQEDPIVHFYETFLAAYDPKLREMRGVYYTPEPVVSYIVRSVDWILKEHFGLEGGLANEESVTYEVTLPDGTTEERESPKVLILDPACGTGTFLYHVIDHIRQQFVQTNNAGKWPGFVGKQLLPRLFGFELLMAPYAVAHLKLGMQLAALDMSEAQREKWAYDFSGDQRLGVYLTNTLEEAEQTGQRQFGVMQTITDEANAAAEVKRDLPIMVVLGNPPYSGHSANNGDWIQGLLHGELPDGRRTESYYEVDGKPLGERNPKWLQDDYVKFIRFGQWRIDETGAGVLAFITNHSYLDNPTFRGMRQSLIDSFSDIHVLNLHGNALKSETAPDGRADENVFDIRMGVAVVLLVRRPGGVGPASVHYADAWGSRDDKYRLLASTDARQIDWHDAEPVPPHYLLVPQDTSVLCEYQAAPELTWAMPLHGVGCVTTKDELLVDFCAGPILERMTVFRDFDGSNDGLHQRLSIRHKKGWDIGGARRAVEKIANLAEEIIQYDYRPFDTRCLFYHPSVVWRTVDQIMCHMQRHNNVALVTQRRIVGDGVHHFFASRRTWDLHLLGTVHSGADGWLLYLYPDPEKLDDLGDSPWPPGEEGRRPNLSEDFVKEFAGKLGLEFVSDGRGDLLSGKTFGPEDIFDYIYAVFHSPTYRERYAEFLKIDFPRVPLTSDADLFRDLVGLGGELVRLHLMEHPDLAREADRISYPAPGEDEVEKGHPKYFPPGEVAPGEAEPLERGRVYINGTKRKADAPQAQYFEGIAPEVWEFQVGGYQVLGKWLKDRKGRTLSYEDIQHYQRVAVALERTMALMARIDERIEEWPIG